MCTSREVKPTAKVHDSPDLSKQGLRGDNCQAAPAEFQLKLMQVILPPGIAHTEKCQTITGALSLRRRSHHSLFPERLASRAVQGGWAGPRRAPWRPRRQPARRPLSSAPRSAPRPPERLLGTSQGCARGAEGPSGLRAVGRTHARTPLPSGARDAVRVPAVPPPGARRAGSASCFPLRSDCTFSGTATSCSLALLSRFHTQRVSPGRCRVFET